MHFSTSQPGKTIENFATITIFAYVTTSVRPTNIPNLVEIGSQVAPPSRHTVVKYYGFVLFVSFFVVFPPHLKIAILIRFARFLAQTMCFVSCTCHKLAIVWNAWRLQLTGQVYRDVTPSSEHSCRSLSQLTPIRLIQCMHLTSGNRRENALRVAYSLKQKSASYL